MGPVVISVASGKGGVGKTTTVANISIALAGKGLKVLAWDLDGQGNLGQAFGIDMANVGLSSYHLMSGKLNSVARAIRPTRFKGVSLVPAHMELFAAEQELVDNGGKEFILRNLLQQPEAKAFDVILIDLPPNLGFQTVNGFAASRWVLIPLQISGFALTGLRQLSHAIRLAQEHLNPELELMGLVPTFVNARTIFSRDLIEALHLIPGTRVFQPHIPYSVRVAEGSLTGLPVMVSSPRSPAAMAYAEITEAVWGVVRSSPEHVLRAPAPTIAAPARAQDVTDAVSDEATEGAARADAAALGDGAPPLRRQGFLGRLLRALRTEL
jgi:chromosome partitioning protein